MQFYTVKRRIFTNVAIGFSLLLLMVVGAAAAIPGTQRALAPNLYGVIKIGDHIYIDQTNQTEKAIRLISTSKAAIKQFFGELTSNPTIIICAKSDCFDRFGGGPRGITYGSYLVKIGPKGFNQMILTHELFHAELHKRMGVFGMVKPIIPVWFDEGVATYISKDPRYRETYTKEELEWIKSAKSYFKDWGNHIKERGWKTTYGAAKAIIVNISHKKGERAILKIIDDVTRKNIPFETALTEAQS